MNKTITTPGILMRYADRPASSNELGMRALQERVYQKRGEQYLLIKSPPASGKSRALMFIALGKELLKPLDTKKLIETFKLSNINRKQLEALLHRFFSGARLDVAFKDRFGQEVEPREWFLVPLPIIEEAIGKLMDGSISNYRYDPDTAQIVEGSGG